MNPDYKCAKYTIVGESVQLNVFPVVVGVFTSLNMIIGFVFLPIMLFLLIGAFLGGPDYLKIALFLLMLLLKYLIIGIQIFGVYFCSGKENKSIRTILVYIVAAMMLIEFGIMVWWAVSLFSVGGTMKSVMIDPVVISILLGEVCSVPGILGMLLAA